MRKSLLIFIAISGFCGFTCAQSDGNVAVASMYAVWEIKKPVAAEGNEELTNSKDTKLKLVYEGKEGKVKPVMFRINLKSNEIVFSNGAPFNDWVGETIDGFGKPIVGYARYENIKKTGTSAGEGYKVLEYDCTRGKKKCRILFGVPKDDSPKYVSIIEKAKNGTSYMISYVYIFLGE